MADITINIADVVKSNNVKTFSNKTMSYTQNTINVHSSGVTGGGWGTILFTDDGNGVNPLDSTTYYLGAVQLAITTTENTIRRFHFAKACTIVGAEVTIKNLGGAGTSEASTVFIRHNNTTNYNISTTMVTTVQSPSVNIANNDSLNIAVAAGEYIIPGWTTPAWITNPGLCVINFLIKVKY